jgi:DNA-binding transcriptional MerR regulator
MSYNPNKNLKLYYSIKEVADVFGVNESLLRYWEQEFPQIRPHKSPKGNRQYTQENIEEIRLVYHLVKEKGLTLDGARKRITDNKAHELDKLDMITRLEKIKQEILDIKNELD